MGYLFSDILAQQQTAQVGLGIIGIKPTGNDQAAEIQTYFRDTVGVRNGLDFGEGDYVIGSPITIYARDTLNSGQGVGLTMRGAGPGRTRLLYTGDKTQHAITITDPNAATVARRDYLAKLADFSLLSCDSGGTLLSGVASIDGSAIFSGPVSGTGYGGGHVLHTTQMERILFEGWKYCLTLDDVTLLQARNLWLRDFVEGIRLGMNVDIVSLEHCMFGSEQYGASYRNTASAVKTGWVGINGSGFVGGSNCFEFDHCWFMKHGCALEDILTAGSKFEFRECYFEGMLQYYKSEQTSGIVRLKFEDCHFSLPTDNDSSAPKIQMPAVQGCEVVMTGCDGPQATGPAGGQIGFYQNFGRVTWRNNVMAAGGGHIRHLRSGDTAIALTIPDYGQHNIETGGATSMWRIAGELLKYTNASASGAVSVRPETQGQDIVLTTSGAITALDVPLFNTLDGSRIKVTITATLSTHTIAWHSRFVFHTAFVQPPSDGKTTTVEFENRGSKWVQVSGLNTWW